MKEIKAMNNHDQIRGGFIYVLFFEKKTSNVAAHSRLQACGPAGVCFGCWGSAVGPTWARGGTRVAEGVRDSGGGKREIAVFFYTLEKWDIFIISLLSFLVVLSFLPCSFFFSFLLCCFVE